MMMIKYWLEYWLDFSFRFYESEGKASLFI